MRAENNGVGIEYDVVGEGKPVVLIHGFPDTRRLWRHQIPVLRDAGFLVIVPDMRGYGRSDKPAEVASYAVRHLVSDVTAVMDQVGVDKAHIVGHDWGGGVAWALGMSVPQRVDHLVVLAAGHPTSFATVGMPQKEKSWYVLLFQFEGVAERWLSDNGWANFLEWSHHPDGDEQTAELEADGSLTPALNWYRANYSPKSLLVLPPPIPVTVPTLGIWGEGDLMLTEAQMTGSEQFMTGGWRYERVEGAGHWIPLSAPDRVNDLLLDFLPR